MKVVNKSEILSEKEAEKMIKTIGSTKKSNCYKDFMNDQEND